MKIIEKYKMGFDAWGLILFFFIMIPNLIWFTISAPNDILRVESATPIIDTVGSIVQAVMVFALCAIINIECKRPMQKRFRAGVIAAALIYFVGWIFYYNGVISPVIVLDLLIAPCLAFILFAAGRKNIFALVLAIMFSICHFIYGFVNFAIYIIPL